MTTVKSGPVSQNLTPPVGAIVYVGERGESEVDSAFTKATVEEGGEIAVAAFEAAEAAQEDATDALAAAAAAQADATAALDAVVAPRHFGAERTLVLAAGMLTATGVAYWQYLGYFAAATVIRFVRAHVVTVGVGSQAAEVALASSPQAPNRQNQTLTKIAAQAVTADLTAVTGLIANPNEIATSIPADTHLWCGLRIAMGTTQPTMLAIANDMSQGQILSTAAAGALTGAGPWVGALIAQALTAQAPLLIATKDIEPS